MGPCNCGIACKVLKEYTQPAMCSLLSEPLLVALLLYTLYAKQSGCFADNNGGYGYGQNNNSESRLIPCMPFMWGSQACVQDPCFCLTLKACCPEA